MRDIERREREREKREDRKDGSSSFGIELTKFLDTTSGGTIDRSTGGLIRTAEWK